MHRGPCRVELFSICLKNTWNIDKDIILLACECDMYYGSRNEVCNRDGGQCECKANYKGRLLHLKFYI